MDTTQVTPGKFMRNIHASMIVSGILAVEQVLYGLLVSESGSRTQVLHLASASLFTTIFLLTIVIRRRVATIPHRVITCMEFVPPVAGMAVALMRIVWFEGTLYSIPTIYLAILYGSSVLFILNYLQSTLFFTMMMIGGIAAVSHFTSHSAEVPFLTDFFFNGMIAWLISVMTYRSFSRQYTINAIVQEQNRKLSYLAERDWLTGMYNRRKIDEIINQERFWPPVDVPYAAAVLFDLDLFKQVNDQYGHQVGDQVLRQLANLILETLQPNEIGFRWGGEEFLVFTARDGVLLAEQLRQRIASTLFTGGIRLTASFGVAYLQDTISANEMFKTIDQNLYRAKEEGRNRVISSPGKRSSV